MRSRKASSGLRVGVISQSVPSVLGVHSWFKLNMPFGTSKNAIRIGFAASTANAGVIASNMGRASVAPAPRKNVRRGMDFLRITIFHSPHLEWGAVDDTKNHGRPFLVVRRSITEGSGRIDRRRTGSGGVAPTADAVEIVQREAERVHLTMASRTSRIGPMQFHALAHGQFLRGLIVLQRWNI